MTRIAFHTTMRAACAVLLALSLTEHVPRPVTATMRKVC